MCSIDESASQHERHLSSRSVRTRMAARSYIWIRGFHVGCVSVGRIPTRDYGNPKKPTPRRPKSTAKNQFKASARARFIASMECLPISKFTHAMKYGEGYVTGLRLQWQDGKHVTLWPTAAPNIKIKFPAFIHLQPRPEG